MLFIQAFNPYLSSLKMKFWKVKNEINSQV